MMDEYVEARGERWALCSPDAHYSCLRFGDVEIRQRFQRQSAGCVARARANNLHVPDPNAPLGYESLIEHLGGIDVFLLASGASDGHVAFNPQGCALGERTRVVELAEATRRDNLGTFPQFRDLSEVPRFGVSVGPATIAAHSRAAILVLLGDGKADAMRRVTAPRPLRPGLAGERRTRVRRCTDRRRRGAAASASRLSVVVAALRSGCDLLAIFW